ncbi:ribosomal-processing cysteine protease Prp [Bacillus cereus]|uniref:ribosomal-processing cysteine protease Prp n=1 Tax=Bacillus cereus TaxID=1396 RepID=UPI0021CB947C|nr:ribosomal-processing cysteine protease Prp [Bacillus cereus]MCU7755369.1 ribosomal-processing cysteine protease Prp [Bacillus cereus]MDC7748179.1 ribosomal-processing cysteine protease Prp [Bacillus cereus]UXP13513.1 ribosomal-processing cysteine protease Prp [Bacillus cereus]
MIKITISRTKLGSIQSFKMTGHADYAPHGQDLVCAGTTAVVFGSINAVEELCNVQATIELGSDGGFLTYKLPNDLDVHTAEKAQTLLEGLVVSLKTIELDYGKYIRLIEKVQEV